MKRITCYPRRMNESPIKQGQIITILNLKGGVGKTHTCWLLATICAERGHSMLVADLDPQGNLTSSFVDQPGDMAGAELLFDSSRSEDVRGLIRKTSFPTIDLLSSRPELARYDLSDQRQWEGAELHLSLVDPLESLRSKYDYIVLDCPPRLSLVSFAALCASDYLVIPLESADWGAQGVVQVTTAAEYVQAHYNPRLHLLGYLVSRFKAVRAYQRGYLAELRRQFGERVFDTTIPDLSSFEQSVVDRIPVTLRPKHRRAATIARGFFDEFERRVAAHRREHPVVRTADVRKQAIIATG